MTDTKEQNVTENIEQDVVLFNDAEEAWFWFLQAQAARHEGAKVVAGQALYPRPCEPIDIFKVVDRLYRNRCITIDHINVLKHYGQRLMAPDMNRPREIRAHALWTEAMDVIGESLLLKGIVKRPMDQNFHCHQPDIPSSDVVVNMHGHEEYLR